MKKAETMTVSTLSAVQGGTARAPGLITFRSSAIQVIVIALVLLVATFLGRGHPYVMNIVAYTFLFAGLATAWNIIGGFGGQFSLMHAVFFAIGGYTAVNLFKLGLNPWVALIPAMAMAAAFALIVSWPLFRLRGKFFGIATLAVAEVVLVLANYFKGLTGGSQGMSVPLKPGLQNMIFLDRFHYALLMLGYATVVLLIAAYVYRSRLGYFLQAVRDEQDAARAVGISITSVKLTGMAVSAALTAAGGVLFAMYLRFVDPPTLLSITDIGVRFLLIALIGGIGTLFGPLIGALLIVPMEFILRAYLADAVPGSHLIVLGGALILSALFLKRGVVGLALDVMNRRKEASHG